jgi:undecaprenyl-diphosphatase
MATSQFLAAHKWRIVALVSFVAGLGIFSVVYDNMREQNDLARLDSPILQWLIAHRTPELTTLLQIITNIMAPVTLAAIIIIGALVWTWRKKEAWRPLLLVSSMSLSILTSTVIKNITERSRPPRVDMVPPLEIDYSFPSGHTLGIAVCLLVLGYLLYSRRTSLKRVVGWLLVAVIGIMIVAFSRLYLAYHWVTDISASIGLSLTILGFVIIIDSYREPIIKLFKKLQKRR